MIDIGSVFQYHGKLYIKIQNVGRYPNSFCLERLTTCSFDHGSTLVDDLGKIEAEVTVPPSVDVETVSVTHTDGDGRILLMTMEDTDSTVSLTKNQAFTLLIELAQAVRDEFGDH